MATIAPPVVKIPNYINGKWIHSQATEWLDVTNPATGEIIAQTPLADASEVATAVEAAAAAFPQWRRTPPEERIQPLFTLKQLLEDHIDVLSSILTQEIDNTLTDAKAEWRRASENLEPACGLP